MTRAYETKSDVKPDVISFTQALNPIREPNVHAYVVWIVSLVFVLFQFFIQLSSDFTSDSVTVIPHAKTPILNHLLLAYKSHHK